MRANDYYVQYRSDLFTSIHNDIGEDLYNPRHVPVVVYTLTLVERGEYVYMDVEDKP